jgi:hypothetical protein
MDSTSPYTARKTPLTASMKSMAAGDENTPPGYEMARGLSEKGTHGQVTAAASCHLPAAYPTKCSTPVKCTPAGQASRTSRCCAMHPYAPRNPSYNPNGVHPFRRQQLWQPAALPGLAACHQQHQLDTPQEPCGRHSPACPGPLSCCNPHEHHEGPAALSSHATHHSTHARGWPASAWASSSCSSARRL